MFCCAPPEVDDAEVLEASPGPDKATGKSGGKKKGKLRAIVDNAAAKGPEITTPDPSEPPFMRTACPNGMSWAQYVNTAPSFVDSSGFLAGPWGECVAWGVIFEHANDWGSMEEYKADGVVGGILMSLEKKCKGDKAIMAAADKLEEASHKLAEEGKPLPSIKQAVTLPPDAVPGQPVKVPHPQMPGTYQTVVVPPGGKPGQQISISAPVQPTKTGKTGMSTGSKVAFAAGGVVAVGAVAGLAYYGTVGGGLEGFASDMGDAGDWAGGAAEDVAEWAGGAAEDATEWAGGAAETVGTWAEGAVEDAPGIAEDALEWTTGAADDVGDFVMDLF